MSKETKIIGVIYILTNPSFPEYVKIGYADDLQKRLKQLNQSECVPFAFRAFATYEVEHRLQDSDVHDMIDAINPTLRAIDNFQNKKRKKEFYAMSADEAFFIFEKIAKVSGTSNRLHKLSPEGKELQDEMIAKEIEKGSTYTEDIHLSNTSTDIKNLYAKLKDSIISLGNVSVEPKKLYIAFKAPKNFVDVEINKHSLKVFINMSKGTLKDPYEIAEDVSKIGHWGNGDYRIYMSDDSDFDYIVGLIKQSFSANKK
ncbi:MAG: DUF5655 domain-containing protein [Clostridiales bacterium]|nr:DUF5655 domain-containing protein [Clostridiales bacterium]